MTKQEYISRLQKYLSLKAAEFSANLFWGEKSLQLVISRSRRSKYGDYRPPRPSQPYHKITINHDLEPNPFFVTLLHEYAHYMVYLSTKNEENPHGKTWKKTFRMLLKQAMDNKVFPEHLERAIIQCYFKRENIASGICKDLKTTVGQKPNRALVSDLTENSVFLLQNKAFQKGKKLRTRYECLELGSRKKYRVHADAEVDHVFTEEELKKLNFHHNQM